MNNKITHSELLQRINYDPETGIFTWPGSLNNQWLGKQAGCIGAKGYRVIEISKVRYPAHRLAWFIVTGKWPLNQIDHINMIKDDNRFVNLREATNSQNKRNNKLRADNTSGFKCVHWRDDYKKWVVAVKYPNSDKQTKCGKFSNKIDAAICANYNIAYTYGEFAVLNKIPNRGWSWDHD